MRYLLFLAPLALCAQFSARITSVGPTNAVLTVKGASGPCTLTLREGSASGPIHPDWPGEADTFREDEVINGTTRQIVLGHNYQNRTLAAGTQHHLAYADCGGSGSLTFITAPATAGHTMLRLPGFDSTHWHNVGWPKIDWTSNSKWYVDPSTGVKVKPLSLGHDFTFSDKTDQTFALWAGGSGWTNPSTIVGGSGSTAQTSGTSPIYLYATWPWKYDPRLSTPSNIGVIPWVRCIDGSGADCDVEIMVFTNPGTLPKPDTNIITVRGGASFVQITAGGSTHAYANSAFPSEYPSTFGRGWGDFLIKANMLIPDSGNNATFSAGVGTIVTPTENVNNATLFPDSMQAGQHIWISGASGCTSHGASGICTVAEYTNPGRITLAENVSPGTVAFRPLPWGIAIRKKTATGTVQVGLRYRHSGGFHGDEGAAGSSCSDSLITRSDGVQGYHCAIQYKSTMRVTYFISTDDTVDPVPIWNGWDPDSNGNLSCTISNTDPRDMFCPHGTGIKKARYSGNWGVTPTIWQVDPTVGATTGARYSMERQGIPIEGGGITDSTWGSAQQVTVSTVLTQAQAQTAIMAMAPDQVSSPFQPWPGNPGWAGISGELLITYRTVNGGQDDGPCQIAAWNISTGTPVLKHFFNTTSSDAANTLAFGKCHSIQTRIIPNSVFVSLNNSYPGGGNANNIQRGPFYMSIVAKKAANGTWNTNTALTNPLTDTSHLRTCPSVGTGANQIPQLWANQGANNNNSTPSPGQCLTLRVRGTAPNKVICNSVPKGTASPATFDFALYGACEWNAAYSGSLTLRPGMQFIGNAPIGSGGDHGNYERFRVMTIATDADNSAYQNIVVQRNASREYCCVQGTTNPAPPTWYADPSTSCVLNPSSQTGHLNGWIPVMMPGTMGSCNQSTFTVLYPDPDDGGSVQYKEQPIRTSSGHAFEGISSLGGFKWIGSASQRGFTEAEDPFQQPPLPTFPRRAIWANVGSPIASVVQQYVRHDHKAAPLSLQYYSTDANGVWYNQFRAGNVYTNITGNLWQVGTTLTPNIKVKPWVAIVGRKLLRDISSPATGNQITAASDDYTFCYTYKNNECRAGAAAGTAWIKAPNVFKHSDPTEANHIRFGIEFRNLASIWALEPGVGVIRQFNSDEADTEGSNQSLLTSAFRPIPTHNTPYWGGIPMPDGRHMLAQQGGWLEGMKKAVLLLSFPPLPRKTGRADELSRFTVRVSARENQTAAHVVFGSSPLLYCTSRQEACVAGVTYSGMGGAPFAFGDSDGALTPTECTAGCSIRIPGVPGRPLFYLVKRLILDVWQDDPVRVTIPSY